MKTDTPARFSGTQLEFIAASEVASRAIPPLWPLASSVAVNPFLGQTDQTLTQVSGLLGRVAGTHVTMPNDWYLTRIGDGTITDMDLTEALTLAPAGAPASIEALKAAAAAPDEVPQPLPTVAHLAQGVSGIDWPGLIEDRIGNWAAGYFDTGQALWQVTSGRDAFESWQIFASRDLTPEIAGLTGFAATVAALPGRSRSALSLACDALGLAPDACATYFHQLLLGQGGWSQVARQRLWQAELKGQTDPITTDMLTIRLIWEQALLAQYAPQIGARWSEVCAAHASPSEPTAAQVAAGVLQDAAERAAQRTLAGVLSAPAQDTPQERPALQAAFCIDVRSEVFRRALESLDPSIQTIGFAGFFGLTPAHRDFASDVDEARLPVLLNPGLHSTATSSDNADADQSARLRARAERAWGRFKLAAVSSFAFVEATGPVYVGKLLRDALRRPSGSGDVDFQPHFSDDFALSDRVAAAATILRAMSLTDNFAPLVLLVGHGASVVNNPHASALHCGACGGYKGDVNARLLAGMLNDADLRTGLEEQGITIPADTVFVGALHDTTTDAVSLYDADTGISAPKTVVEQAKGWLAKAAKVARTERALRLPRADGEATITNRSVDWAETRPEWALAGCNAFIAAPRKRTRGKALGGRAFLHDYDWTGDDGFGVLELILTAPVVVASWISLQYYGSVVAPDMFGAGNKLLHNVTGGIGVVEGNGGNLRVGLPWQSVHDGENFAHDPLRLSICVEAPAEAVSDILARHSEVRALFDNRWLHLFLLDGNGQIAQRYAGDLEWSEFGDQSGLAAQVVAA
ncbi:hypothetical protein SAMN05444004_104219 [Jannaschia faecimaris]|uniref:Probable inorganic carbon transporter subunit DabA n=1 Tax=Jannaschia faecimaris TaxID=1244108 RepID=A0A1H3P3B8_9RHOB|nr:DUF2309 domain-containing protein [Jannaschia faecimaris]SDY95530.1 hypothetical protein SAMN05444004_104219 [Jannaschia faecimaris]